MVRRSPPLGISSRIRPAEGERHPWSAHGVVVDLPVIVDWIRVEIGDDRACVLIEARIDLVDGKPALVQMTLDSEEGLDTVVLQRSFRWASPLEVVTSLMPRLIAEGLDPYAIDLPLTGFPEVVAQPVGRRRTLTDEFLTTIAREYLVQGRGYTRRLADQYCVAPRTVVSWIEKARARGLLTPPPAPGSTGGRLA